MRCCNCKQNEAARKYRKIIDGKVVEENYCFDCYQRLMLSLETEKKLENRISVCPYCGTTEEEFRASKLVGCANCYKTLKLTVSPVISRMQGKKEYKGKYPTLETEDDALSLTFEDATEEQILKTRIERQCRELTLIIAKLKAEGKYAQAKGYADKFSLMKTQSKIEEDFVWRCDSETLKRS